MQISGFYYPAGSSRKHDAALICNSEGDCTLLVAGEPLHQVAVGELDISERLGNTLRQLRFPGGELFETDANDEVDRLLGMHAQRKFHGLLHRLENRAGYIFPLLVVAGLSLWFLHSWGLPQAARLAAFSLPASELDFMGEQALAAMDRTVLRPSLLPAERQQLIRQRFQKFTDEIGSGFPYKLHFRRFGKDVANAFALPDGTIVVTDGLVKLAENPWEIDSVLLHEIAHVEERHGLQMVFRDTLITLMISMMLGDAVSTTDAVAALPALLIESDYSRDFEQSADDFSTDYMLVHHVDPSHFSRILQKLSESDVSAVASAKTPEKDAEEEESFWDYFSTHPKMEERIRRIGERSIRFHETAGK